MSIRPVPLRSVANILLAHLFVKRFETVGTPHRPALSPPSWRNAILCGLCGRPLTGSVTAGHGGQYPYYHCYAKECAMYGKGIKKDDMEKDFVVRLNKITPTQEFVEYFKQTVLDEWEARLGQIRSSREGYESQKQQLEATLKKIALLREDGSYTKEQYLKRKAEVETQLLGIGISGNEAHIDQLNMEALLNEALVFATMLGAYWKQMNPLLRSRFQKLVFPSGIPYTRGSGFGTARMGLIFELNQQYTSQNYHLVRPVGIEPTTCRLRVGCSTS